jgi:hypothetical protein
LQDHDDATVARKLWASVIIQALIDATAQPKTNATKVHKAQAIAWITAEFGTTAQDFEEACHHADLDPLTVRSYYKNYDGPPLTMHVLSRLRDAKLAGEN